MTLPELACKHEWARQLLLAGNGTLLAVSEDDRQRMILSLPLGGSEAAWWINVFCASLEIGFRTSETSVRRYRRTARAVEAAGKWYPVL